MCRVPQRDPGELAERVRLLVGQPAAAEHRDGVPAVRRPGRRGRRRRRGRAPRPSSPGAARRRPVADQRRGQPLAGGRAARPRSSPSGTGRPGWSGSRGPRPRPSTPAPVARSVMPHCSAQYGQCVATSRGVSPGASRRPCTVCHVGKACRRAVSGPGPFCFGPVKWASHRTGAASVTGRSTGDAAVPLQSARFGRRVRDNQPRNRAWSARRSGRTPRAYRSSTASCMFAAR